MEDLKGKTPPKNNNRDEAQVESYASQLETNVNIQHKQGQ